MNFIEDKIQSDYRFKNYIEVKDQIQDGMTKAAQLAQQDVQEKFINRYEIKSVDTILALNLEVVTNTFFEDGLYLRGIEFSDPLEAATMLTGFLSTIKNRVTFLYSGLSELALTSPKYLEHLYVKAGPEIERLLVLVNDKIATSDLCDTDKKKLLADLKITRNTSTCLTNSVFSLSYSIPKWSLEKLGQQRNNLAFDLNKIKSRHGSFYKYVKR